jgi:glycosyltransferase involved in cell wall biosynthesis
LRPLFLARHYWPAVGGVESFLRQLALELATRHELRVVAQRIDDRPVTRLSNSLRAPPPFVPFEDGDVRIEPLDLSGRRSRLMMAPLVAQVIPVLRRYAYGRQRRWMGALYARALGAELVKAMHGADLVHIWGGDFLAAAGVHAARRAGVPVVITPFMHPGHWNDDPASVAAYRRADRVIALLEVEAGAYRRLGVAADRVEVCGVCTRGAAGGNARRVRERHRIEGPLVLFLGSRRPYKGIDVLLEACDTVGSYRDDVTLVVAGPGPPAVGTARNVRVIDVGTIEDEERADWLAAADVLCLPSASEILPVSVLEAWSTGTPVVTSDIPTVRELIEKSGGGLAVARDPRVLGEALVRLLAEPERLRKLGEMGLRHWKEHHTVERVGEWHERLYRRLTDSEAAVPCAA